MKNRLKASVLALGPAPALAHEEIALKGPEGEDAVLTLRRRPPGETLARFLRRLNLDQLRQVNIADRESIRALFAKSRRRKPFFSNTLWLTQIAKRGPSTSRRRKLLLVTVVNGKAVGLCAYGFSVLEHGETLTVHIHIDWIYVTKAWRGFGVFSRVRRQIALEALEHIQTLRNRLEALEGRWTVVTSVVGQGESYSGLQFARRQARSIAHERRDRVSRRFRRSRLARATSKHFLF